MKITEIEKKYLIRENGWSFLLPLELDSTTESLKKDVLAHGKKIQQGYLTLEKGMELAEKLGMVVDFDLKEARLRDKAGKLSFTLKGKGDVEREELESEIPSNLFAKYWSLTEGRRVEKVRLEKPYKGHTLEIDVYTDRNLILAEIEVPSLEDAKRLKPIGKDVTDDPRYKNRILAIEKQLREEFQDYPRNCKHHLFLIEDRYTGNPKTVYRCKLTASARTFVLWSFGTMRKCNYNTCPRIGNFLRRVDLTS